jgi:nicotinamidase-related amidase
MQREDPKMLLDHASSLLVIVDMQTSLAPVVAEAERCIQRTQMLLRAARILGVPTIATEQYPDRLGPTVAPLRDELDPQRIFAKLAFSAAAVPEIRETVLALHRPQLVVVGMEAHVCVLQTALGFALLGQRPVVVADAVASRDPANHELALARLAGAGVTVVSSEMVVFEWLARAGTPSFRAMLPLIRDGLSG